MLIGPLKLNEIHGDFNIHNILCQLQPDADRAVVLIRPRGVPLLDASASTGGFEAGDPSKLKFSLSGFAEIRKGLFSLRGADGSLELDIKRHPGSDTMGGADEGGSPSSLLDGPEECVCSGQGKAGFSSLCHDCYGTTFGSSMA